MIYTHDSLMPFGKHKDKKLKDVPADYLVNYIYNIKGLEHGLRNYIDDNMSELTKKLSQSKTHRTQKNTLRKHTSETLTNFFKPFEEMDDKEKIDYLLTENKMLQTALNNPPFKFMKDFILNMKADPSLKKGEAVILVSPSDFPKPITKNL